MIGNSSGSGSPAAHRLAPLQIMIDAAVHQSLLVRPARRSGEHAGGYWLRAAHRNGLTRPGWLLGDSSRPPVSLVRVCPACLAQSQPVWLEAWANEGWPVCASHGTWLVDACAGCKRTLRWSEVRFLACCCGQDLRALPATGMTPPVRRALIDDGVPLSVLAWLGALALHGLHGKPLKKASRQRLQDVIVLAQAGAEITSDWPEAFHRTLDGCRSEGIGSPGGLQLFNEALPGLMRQVRRLRDTPWRALVSKALGDYATGTRQSPRPLIGRNVPGAALPTVGAFAKVMGVRVGRLAQALEELPEDQAPRRSTIGGRVRRLVTQRTATRARRALDDEISVKEAARRLGLTARRVRELVTCNRLKTSRGRPIGTGVAELRRSMGRRTKAGPLPADAVPVNQALRFWVSVGMTAEWVEAVERGEISVYRPARSGADKRQWVSRSEVCAWAARPPATPSPWLTIPECADRLGLKQQVVYHLVGRGFIQTQQMSVKGRPARMATAEALEVFGRQFEPLARAAVRSGADHRRGLQWARENGVELVSGPVVDGGRQYFVRRAPSP